MSTDKNTPGEWRVRVRRGVGEPDEPVVILDCFVTAPDVHGYAYDAEILGDDEYHDGIERKLADCQLIAAAPAMREALRAILTSEDAEYMRGLAKDALAKLDEVPR